LFSDYSIAVEVGQMKQLAANFMIIGGRLTLYVHFVDYRDYLEEVTNFLAFIFTLQENWFVASTPESEFMKRIRIKIRRIKNDPFPKYL
jgi:hypothetical protein